MALTNEDLQAIAKLLHPMQESITGIQQDVSGLKQDVSSLKQEMIDVRLHIENVTDRNIRILAENHIDLINKMNQIIPFADKNKAYEVKVNYLFERVDKLEEEMVLLKNEVKSKTA